MFFVIYKYFSTHLGRARGPPVGRDPPVGDHWHSQSLISTYATDRFSSGHPPWQTLSVLRFLYTKFPSLSTTLPTPTHLHTPRQQLSPIVSNALSLFSNNMALFPYYTPLFCAFKRLFGADLANSQKTLHGFPLCRRVGPCPGWSGLKVKLTLERGIINLIQLIVYTSCESSVGCARLFRLVYCASIRESNRLLESFLHLELRTENSFAEQIPPWRRMEKCFLESFLL